MSPSLSTARLNLFWLILFGATMPVAVVLSTHLARRSLERIKLRDQTVTVKGYAEKPIVSDRGVWSATLTVRRPQLKEAYAELEAHRARLLGFLAQQGFPAESVELYPVGIGQVWTRDAKGNVTNTLEAYRVTQSVGVASPEVGRIAKVAREVSALIGEGLELDCDQPEYLYTRLDELKLQMLGEATRNARERAEKLVSAGSSSLGPLRGASQGVFQITRPFSTEVSDGGMNDTHGLHKVVKAVVTVEYAIAD